MTPASLYFSLSLILLATCIRTTRIKVGFPQEAFSKKEGIPLSHYAHAKSCELHPSLAILAFEHRQYSRISREAQSAKVELADTSYPSMYYQCRF